MPDMTRKSVHTPWFDARVDKPARSGFYEYFDTLLDEILLIRWNRKKDRWEKNNCILGGDKWRGLTLDGYITVLESASTPQLAVLNIAKMQ